MSYSDLPIGAIYLKPLQYSIMIKRKDVDGRSVVLDYFDHDRVDRAMEIAKKHGEPNPPTIYVDDRS